MGECQISYVSFALLRVYQILSTYISKGYNKIAVKKYIHSIDFIIATIRILNFVFRHFRLYFFLSSTEKGSSSVSN